MYAFLSAVSAFVSDRFDKKDRGATAVEYGLLVGLIAVVIIAAVILLGEQLNVMFTDITGALTTDAGVVVP
ncbi:Flp family type IVb pilin [Agrococcus sediminis]|uniref:Flp family type IVb pilin n=1 Tax=Agrococcus sediminis TaxID=2599924 RepID=UPI00344A0894